MTKDVCIGNWLSRIVKRHDVQCSNPYCLVFDGDLWIILNSCFWILNNNNNNNNGYFYVLFLRRAHFS